MKKATVKTAAVLAAAFAAGAYANAKGWLDKIKSKLG